MNSIIDHQRLFRELGESQRKLENQAQTIAYLRRRIAELKGAQNQPAPVSAVNRLICLYRSMLDGVPQVEFELTCQPGVGWVAGVGVFRNLPSAVQREVFAYGAGASPENACEQALEFHRRWLEKQAEAKKAAPNSPEIPEGWTLSKCGQWIERDGDGVWIREPGMQFLHGGCWFTLDQCDVGSPSGNGSRYRCPWSPGKGEA